jgi:Putative transmembrane protein (PGPGW)|tara:strand:- start:6048 stop:6332 length:285 start_codon:yes stop_codon:yes gene_type:complete
MDLKTIKRPLKLVVGSVMFVVGIITAPFPLPIGQFVALIGLSLLVSESHWLKTKMQKLRRRLPLIGRQLQRVHPHMPKFLKKVIDDTDPVHLAE